MLALRNFSYFDTQISRLGGVNFNQIPINQSRCPFTSTARDGHHAHMIKAAPNYHPNRFELPKVQQMDGANYATSDEAIKKATKTEPGWQTFSPYEVKQGTFGRLRPEKFAEHTNQATYFYNSMRYVFQTLYLLWYTGLTSQSSSLKRRRKGPYGLSCTIRSRPL